MNFSLSQKGLTNKQAEELIEKHGLNILPQSKTFGLVIIFLSQFLNPFIYILLAAALISLFLKEISSTVFIFIVLLIDAAIGTVQEYSAQKAALALKKIVPEFAIVIRDGKEIKIPAKNVVIGDLIILSSGDKAAADIKLIKSHNLTIDESILTGESLEIVKNADLSVADDAPISERYNQVFAGTIVTRGRGVGIVIATAINTQIGNIAKSIAAQKEVKTPLLLRMEKFTLNIAWLILAIAALLMLSFIIRGESLTEVLFIIVALAISAIPEGLPASITVALAVGSRHMVANNVIIRKLTAAETLGSCTFIASDKTGTLTINELTIVKIALPNNEVINIEGQGLELVSNILEKKYESKTIGQIIRFCKSAILAGEAALEIENNQITSVKGDQVDVAFLILGEKYQISQDALTVLYPKISEIPYESERGYCAVICQYEAQKLIFVKGSVEKIINMCSLMSSDEGDIALDKKAILKQEEEFAKKGYRVLAVAEAVIKEHDKHHIAKNNESLLKDMVFLGLAVMIDPIRKEVKEAVRHCKEAHIEVAMITGDHPATALAIAKECGLLMTDESCENNVVTGKEIDQASKKGAKYLNMLTAKNRVFARIAPLQKQEIVNSLIANNHFVAVTGDGVNDAAALKQAHIGVAMGKSGSDLTREVSDIILTDDNFASIVEGIKQGRIIYNNIRKVIFLLITTGFAEVILFLLSILFNLPMPLIAVQLLWLNLVTGGFQDVALAFEPEEGNELKKPPRPPNEKIFNSLMIKRLLLDGFLIGILAFITFKWLTDHGKEVEEARNITLLLMVLFENIHALNSRSENNSLFQINFFSNSFLIGSVIITQIIHIVAMHLPIISDILQISPIAFKDWVMLLIIALILLITDELFKLGNFPLNIHK